MNESLINYELKKIEFEYAIKQRNFEIVLFWKRSWFFGALVLAMIGGLYNIKDEAKLYSVFLSFILFITTLAQGLMNRGSKYWHERWEYMTKNRESALGIELTNLKKFSNTKAKKGEWYYLEACIIAKGESTLTRAFRWSVSKLTFLIWDIICICSFFCWANYFILALDMDIQIGLSIKIFGFHIIIITYIFLFILKGKVYSNDQDNVKFKELEKLEEDYVSNNII
jgi:hypothetical protein